MEYKEEYYKNLEFNINKIFIDIYDKLNSNDKFLGLSYTFSMYSQPESLDHGYHTNYEFLLLHLVIITHKFIYSVGNNIRYSNGIYNIVCQSLTPSLVVAFKQAPSGFSIGPTHIETICTRDENIINYKKLNSINCNISDCRREHIDYLNSSQQHINNSHSLKIYKIEIKHFIDCIKLCC